MSLRRTWLGHLAGVWGAALAGLAALALMLSSGDLGQLGAVRQALSGPGVAPLPAPVAGVGSAPVVPAIGGTTGSSRGVAAGSGAPLSPGGALTGGRRTVRLQVSPSQSGPARTVSSPGGTHRPASPSGGTPARRGGTPTARPGPQSGHSPIDPVIGAGAGLAGTLPGPAGPAAAGAVRAAGGAVDGLIPGGR